MIHYFVNLGQSLHILTDVPKDSKNKKKLFIV